MKNYGTREMVLAALGIALVYITTMFIKLPNSIGGYLNLGDSQFPRNLCLCPLLKISHVDQLSLLRAQAAQNLFQ